MDKLLSKVPKVALAIYAHPDDAEISCGGSLARWSKLGSQIHRVTATDGGKGTDNPDVSPSDLVEIRRAETAEADTCLGVTEQHWLGYGDGELEDGTELIGRLVSLVRGIKPELVLCPDPTAVFFGRNYLNHRDHRILGIATLDAVMPAAAMPHYYPEAGRPHHVEMILMSGTLSPDTWVDISTSVEDKAEAVTCHRSQLAGEVQLAADAVRIRAEEEGSRVGVRWAECYRMLCPQG